MKKILLICLIYFNVFRCMAAHIVGGEMIYQYVGPGQTANTSSYIITLKLFRDQNCVNCAAMPSDVFIGIFNNDNSSQYPGTNLPYDISKSDELQVPVKPFPPCITNPPQLNYHVGIFVLNVTLPNNTNGYTTTYQNCCRVKSPPKFFKISRSIDGSA